MHFAFGVAGNIFFVCDQHDGDAFAVECLEQRHDFFAGMAVEIAGGFIGKNQARTIDQGSRNCNALLLTAGNLIGQRGRFIFQSHLGE